MQFALIVPTYNAGQLWNSWVAALAMQTMLPAQTLLIDSESTDGVISAARTSTLSVVSVSKASFNHGGTRSFALNLLDPSTEVVVFMTQDALLADPHSLENLVSVFSDQVVSAAYGRQLPHDDAGHLAAHLRSFNYGPDRKMKSIDSVGELGLKACFISNSFAAYRVKDLHAVGGFPADVILGEDMYVGGKLLLNGKTIAYVPSACVKHSHDYSIFQDFRRYFDTGVFHSMEPWLLDNFGGVSGEGGRFVRSELVYLKKHQPSLIPSSLIRTAVKFLGYKLGRMYKLLPNNMVTAFSMHKGFWAGRPAP